MSILDYLFYDDHTELSGSDVSEEEDGEDASCLIHSHLDGSELFSMNEVVGETLVVELAIASLQFKHCQCYFGFSRVCQILLEIRR